MWLLEQLLLVTVLANDGFVVPWVPPWGFKYRLIVDRTITNFKSLITVQKVSIELSLAPIESTLSRTPP